MMSTNKRGRAGCAGCSDRHGFRMPTNSI